MSRYDALDEQFQVRCTRTVAVVLLYASYTALLKCTYGTS